MLISLLQAPIKSDNSGESEPEDVLQICWTDFYCAKLAEFRPVAAAKFHFPSHVCYIRGTDWHAVEVFISLVLQRSNLSSFVISRSVERHLAVPT